MEYTGLIQKFPIDRPLTENERRLQLKQKERIETEPLYQLSVIRMNSTFLEMTDKFYSWKGLLTTFFLPAVIALTAFYTFILFKLYLGDWSRQETPTPWWMGAILIVTLVPFDFFFIWAFLKESFAFTHYPIRMNRKTRMVHVFRLTGTVLSVPWDEVFFTIGKCASPRQWDVRGHVLDKDGVTVRESFSLSDWDYGGAAAQDVVRGYWEFVRRYMEDGPGAVNDRVHFCMPIAAKRESLKIGFERMFAVATGQPLPVLLFVALIAALLTPGRWFAMRTSKIPVWPQAIEDVCVIEPNDPFVKDASMNPEDLR